MAANDRLKIIRGHLVNSPNSSRPVVGFQPVNVENDDPRVAKNKVSKGERTIPKKRQDVLKWNGWGYKDSGFLVYDYPDWKVEFSGDRYQVASNVPLPYFRQWVENEVGVDFRFRKPSQPEHKLEDYPKPIINDLFLEELANTDIAYSLDGEDRLVRAHGQTFREILILREQMYDRIPDLVVWVTSHDETLKVVNLATQYNVVIIPIGGGTCVSAALECPPEEKRMIVSLDTTQMNKILWINSSNLLVHVESGIVGQDLERELADHGFCTGHEPDSYELSTVGGWVATRASGMKKNVYGNIEDLVVHMKVVTPTGVFERNCEVPRLSSGPDIHEFILGSEGTLGVVTEVTMKIRPLPEIRRYGSIVFSSFEPGLNCMREIAKQRCAPASIRLMDNEQFKFGLALKGPASTFGGRIVDALKKSFLTKIKGFSFDEICVATIVFEGKKEYVDYLEKKVYSIGAKFGGIPAGEENGKRGYMLTFVIAYIRDLGMEYCVAAESFETSVPWDRVVDLCKNVKHRLAMECRNRGIVKHFASYRVTQTYDAGVCVYFYFGLNYRGFADPIKVYEEIETIARHEILANGGSISHHHGVGKLRQKFLRQTISSVGMQMLLGVKQSVDPNNIFGSGNLNSTWEPKSHL